MSAVLDGLPVIVTRSNEGGGHMTDPLNAPLVTLEDGVLTFIHDCRAACGDGKVRLLRARRYQLDLRWTVLQRDPLTIDPSIDCGACRAHGWFKHGMWVAA